MFFSYVLNAIKFEEKTINKVVKMCQRMKYEICKNTLIQKNVHLYFNFNKTDSSK